MKTIKDKKFIKMNTEVVKLHTPEELELLKVELQKISDQLDVLFELTHTQDTIIDEGMEILNDTKNPWRSKEHFQNHSRNVLIQMYNNWISYSNIIKLNMTHLEKRTAIGKDDLISPKIPIHNDVELEPIREYVEKYSSETIH